jgi:Chaperone for flagella basal body P-ring formation
VTALRNIVVCIATLACVSLAGASATRPPLEVEQADPISGLHWQRVTDPTHPSAPPRLTLTRGSGTALIEHRELRRPTICVRAGDHVSLHSTNAGFSMFSLEATALQNGACGARVRARVAVTGAMVEMTVLDSGAGVLTGKAAAWQ